MNATAIRPPALGSALGSFFRDERHLYGRCLLGALVAALLSRLLLLYIAPLFGVSGSGLYCQFDCGWYRNLVAGGYHREPVQNGTGQANWAFFPLFPLSIHLLRSIVPKASFLDLSATFNSILFVLSCWLLFRIVGRQASPQRAAMGVLAFAFFPVSFYFFSPYTEALFLFLTVLGIDLLQRGHFVRAGLAAALLSATRNQGAFFVVVILAYGLDAYRAKAAQPRSERIRLGRDVALACLLAPVGVVAFSAYLYWLVGDALAFVHIQAAWGREFVNPALLILHVVRLGDPFQVFALFTLMLAAVAVTWLASCRLWGEAVFGALYVAAAAMSGNWMAMPRYVLASPLFALFVVLALPRLPRPVFWLVIACEIVLLATFVGQWFRSAEWLI